MLSGIPLAGRDVDHVVLAPKGCFAVEVKAFFGRRGPLDRAFGLDAKLAQARRGAVLVRHLLASRGVEVPVMPVLAGPGAPQVAATTTLQGVLVVALRDADTWAPQMAGAASTLDLQTARRIAEELTAYSAEHAERTRARGAGNRVSGRRGDTGGFGSVAGRLRQAAVIACRSRSART